MHVLFKCGDIVFLNVPRYNKFDLIFTKTICREGDTLKYFECDGARYIQFENPGDNIKTENVKVMNKDYL